MYGDLVIGAIGERHSVEYDALIRMTGTTRFIGPTPIACRLFSANTLVTIGNQHRVVSVLRTAGSDTTVARDTLEKEHSR